MDTDKDPVKHALGLRSRLLLGAVAVVVLGLVLTAIVTTVLERGRGGLDLDPQGQRRLGVLIANRDASTGQVSWRALASTTLPTEIVVLVHGLDEPGSIWDDLTPALLDAGHAVARFEYPNDQSIARSAELFAQHMQSLRDRGVRTLDIVCHSMGGLVARDMLTRQSLYTSDRESYPNVGRLILVGTPNLGSPLAPLQPISEMRELLVRWAVSFGDVRVLGTTQGPAQAAKDLAPNSDFLRDLNSRPLPESVAFTIIAGRVVPIDAEQTKGFLEDSALRNVLPSEDVDIVFAQLDSLIQGIGDGVVPLESAMLLGVDDIVLLSANHRSMLKKSAIEHTAHETIDLPMQNAPAIAIIVDRLGAAPPSRNE